MDEFERIVILEYERDELLRGIKKLLEEVLYAKSCVDLDGETVESYRHAFTYLAKAMGYVGRMECRWLKEEDESLEEDETFVKCKALSEQVLKMFKGA